MSFLLQVDILTVLPILCSRAYVSDCRVICRMLSVSGQWRTTLLQCQPFVVVDVSLASGQSLGKLATGFASWLEMYGPIISKLTFSTRTTERYVLNAADHIVGSSIELSCLAGKPAGLQCVAMDYLKAPRLLRSLPAATLTSLTVQKLDPTHPSISYLAPNIQHLTNLRSCDLTFRLLGAPAAGVAIPPSCLSSLNMLSRLTSLKVSAVGYSLGQIQHLPQQLQQLTILTSGQFIVDASALTMLTALQLTATGGISTETRLPTSLSSVKLTCTPLQPGLLPVLKSVRNLSLSAHVQIPAVVLAQLRRLPDLHSMDMTFIGRTAATAAAAAAWKQLPQLQKLQLWLIGGDDNNNRASDANVNTVDQTRSVILPGLAAAKQLTRLSLWVEDANMQKNMPCCSYAAQLSNLKRLELSGVCGLRKDVLTLRSLTKLTMLRLLNCALDDAAAGGLICSLTNLRRLHLMSCYNLSDAILPAMAAQLQGLRELRLSDLGDWSESSVELLAELTQLSSLAVSSCTVTAAGVEWLKQSASFMVYTGLIS